MHYTPPFKDCKMKWYEKLVKDRTGMTGAHGGMTIRARQHDFCSCFPLFLVNRSSWVTDLALIPRHAYSPPTQGCTVIAFTGAREACKCQAYTYHSGRLLTCFREVSENALRHPNNNSKAFERAQCRNGELRLF